jgi:hypothetical protein
MNKPPVTEVMWNERELPSTTLTTNDDLSSNRQSVIALKTLSESIILLVRWFGIKLLIAADSVFTKSVEKIVRIVLIGQQ